MDFDRNDFSQDRVEKRTGGLSREDRLRVWAVAVKSGIAAPISSEANGHLLVSLDKAVKALNALPDGPRLRPAQLKLIAAEFKNVDFSGYAE